VGRGPTPGAVGCRLERSILSVDEVYINGGRRGLLVVLAPSEIVRVLNARLMDAAI
jgi:prolyl-tRNA editing enzyme YbaK/EbsC (Cys-tRNA(Pro) deacylase)